MLDELCGLGQQFQLILLSFLSCPTSPYIGPFAAHLHSSFGIRFGDRELSEQFQPTNLFTGPFLDYYVSRSTSSFPMIPIPPTSRSPIWNTLKLLLHAMLLLHAPGALAQGTPTKIDCLEDSITAGAGARSQFESYPSQLARMLGEGYEIEHLGVSGATLLSNGDSPYIKTDFVPRITAFHPDIVTISLGGNDTKPESEADTAVRPDQKILLLARRYKAMGGEIKLIGNPGVGHHPHSLQDPTPIVDFIQAHEPKN